MDDLKDRLRARKFRHTVAGAVKTNAHRNPEGPEAADRIEALEASLAEARAALNPSGSTKYAYSGEFKFTEVTGFDDDGSEIYQEITVPWTTIKEIMSAIRDRALKGQADK